MQLTANIRIYPYYIRVLRIGVTIEKTIQLFTVAVQIEDESYIPFFAYLKNVRFYCGNLRAIQIFLRGVPFSIEVLA